MNKYTTEFIEEQFQSRRNICDQIQEINQLMTKLHDDKDISPIAKCRIYGLQSILDSMLESQREYTNNAGID